MKKLIPALTLSVVMFAPATGLGEEIKLPAGLCKSGFGTDEQGRALCVEMTSNGEAFRWYRYGVCGQLRGWPMQAVGNNRYVSGPVVFHVKRVRGKEVHGPLYFEGRKAGDMVLYC